MNPTVTQSPSLEVANGKEETITPNQALLMKLRINKEGWFLFRRRRQPDWIDNYTLYRDKVQLNRLTQRQSVNIPLIKSTIKTLLKDIDDPPMLYFSDINNDDQQEVFYNEYWNVNSRDNALVIKDIVDKRQVLLYGRSFKFMNIIDGKFFWEVVAPDDVLVDRYVDPSDIDTARGLCREHIYKPLSSLKTNPKLDTAAVDRLQHYMGTEMGLIKAQENQLDWVLKQQAAASLGVIDAYNPILGETYVELNEFYIKEFNKKTGRDEIMYVITAEDMEVLYAAPLEECIGNTQDNFWATHYPCTTWGDETERADFWSDGVADALRTLNKVLNAWFSQLVENRTLRNFGMNYFNSSLTEEGFMPQTFEPVPWGWYPIPAGESGKLGDQIMHVDIPDLEDTLEHMRFVMEIAQQVSAATTTQQGLTQEKGPQITLGEVQLALKNAEDRVKAMKVYYNASWEDFGLKYTKMIEAASDIMDDVVVYKKGRLTNKNYAKNVSPSEWFQKMAYKVEVRMRDDVQAQTADSLQKLQYSKSLMPANQALDSIIKKKSLDFANLSASEMEEVMKEDEQQMAAMAAAPPQMGVGQPGTPQQQQPMLQSPQQQPMQA